MLSIPTIVKIEFIYHITNLIILYVLNSKYVYPCNC